MLNTENIRRSTGDHIFNACNITLFVIIAILLAIFTLSTLKLR